MARFLDRLSSFARVISFDRRGTGLSDRGVGPATLEDHVRDVGTVMDAAGSEQAAVAGQSEGGTVALLSAATYPERTEALILWGAFARFAEAPDYPIGFPEHYFEEASDYVGERWGTGVGLSAWAPSVADDPSVREWWARFQRLAASPGDVRAVYGSYPEMDVRGVLPAISVPTLVLHRRDDRMVPVEMGRYVAERIEGARFVELPGADHFLQTENPGAALEEMEEFLTGTRHGGEPTRRLATVVVTDIVGSTEEAAERGDREWVDLLERHNAMTRRALRRFDGREVQTTGDGFLAVFDGPTSAVRCAEAIRDGAAGLGCEIRAGVHTGEIELREDDIGGIAVHIASRVADLAEAGEIWVSATVPGVVVGSGIEFSDRGSHELKGVPGEWELYAVERL